MPPRRIARRQLGAATTAPEALGHDNPVLALQRAAGNRAVTQLIARSPSTTATVEISGVGKIKVKGGNLEEWTGKAGENLNVGGGTQLLIKGARIKYSVEGGVETWQVIDFTDVKRTKITHTIGAG